MMLLGGGGGTVFLIAGDRRLSNDSARRTSYSYIISHVFTSIIQEKRTSTYPRYENGLLAPQGHRQASIEHSLSDDKPLLERDVVEPQACRPMGLQDYAPPENPRS
jgi:hypothetical protein